MNQSWSRSGNEVLATLQDVVAIESVNPDLPGGCRGEAGMVEYIAEFFGAIGVPYETHEILPGRSNIVATLEGVNPNRVMLFECHMDTASADIMTIPPFEPHIRDDLLYGRGASDTKAGGVAMMHAMKRLKAAGVKPPCTIKYVGAVDEEYRFRGALHLAETVKADAAIIAEPTELAVIRAHKGIARFRIVVKGIAAHSSKPQLGVNAISKMARIISAIESELAPTYETNVHPLVGSPTVNVGVISGGTQFNFVPDRCVIEVDRRVIPGQTPKAALEEFRELLLRAQAADSELDAFLEEPFLLDDAMETPEDATIVQIAINACRAVQGTGAITGVPYGTDASKFTAVGIPAIVFGPGSIDQAHAAVEWISCKQVLTAVDIYQQIMMSDLVV